MMGQGDGSPRDWASVAEANALRIRGNTVARMMARLAVAGVSASVSPLRRIAWACAVDLNIDGAGEPVLLYVEDGHVCVNGFEGGNQRIGVRKNRASATWLAAFVAELREQVMAAVTRQQRALLSQQERAAKDAERVRRERARIHKAPTLIADVAAMMLARDVDDRDVSRADAMALLERCKDIVTPEDIVAAMGRLAMSDVSCGRKVA